MKVFLTGGSGFIGRNLKEQLSDKYSILAPGSWELDLTKENEVRDYLKRNKFKIIIHCATWDATRNSRKDHTKILPNNLRMFFNLARCSNLFGKMILLGSGEVYSRPHWIPGMDETYFDTHIPHDDSGFSKYIMAKYLQNTENIVELCLFAVFGKYEDWEIRFISNACCKAVSDMPITIKQNVLLDYMYIDDLIGIIEWFMLNDAKHKRYNICSGKTHDLITLAQKVIATSGKKLDISVRTEGMGREYSGNNSRLLQETSGFRFSNIDESIIKLYYWYLSNKDLINTNLLLSDK